MNINIISSENTGTAVSTVWSAADRWGAMQVRWSYNRDSYKINPGLYRVGNPDRLSDIFVSANYKLSFDHLRTSLHGMNAWILVLDTKGINVWCAAGKGTFGTNELVYRIFLSGLNRVSDNKRLIVPQLGAVGVSAHQVKTMSGYTVVFGPVEASDIPAFIANGYRCSKEMRKVRFNMYDRIKLVPIELVYGWKYLLGAMALLYLLSGLHGLNYSIEQLQRTGFISVFILLNAYLAGAFISPALLPWLPFRSFSAKGAFTGIVMSILFLCIFMPAASILFMLSALLITTAISSFMCMNFTGSSTYTNLSGVKKEMKIALPLQIAAAAIGLILFITDKFIAL